MNEGQRIYVCPACLEEYRSLRAADECQLAHEIEDREARRRDRPRH